MQIIRIIITAILFILFGAISICGNLFFIPILLLGLNKFSCVKYFCRYLVSSSWNLFLIATEILLYQRSNSKILKPLRNLKSTIIVCNHPSLLDVVFFLAKVRYANCVVKKELMNNIFLYPAIKSCGYIINNDDLVINSSIEALRNGENLIIFPEGSRTKDEIQFHKGAFYIAINGAKNLQLIFLDMKPRSLKKGQKWFDTPKTTIKYNFVVGDCINIENFMPNSQNTIRVRKFHSDIEQRYKKEIIL